MRGDDAVFGAQQGIIRADGLGGHHVERGRCYLTAVQRVGKILLSDDLAAAVVDDNDAVFHLGDVFLADEPGVAGQKRHVNTDHIRLREQLVQRDIFADGAARVVGVGVVDENAHAERFGDGTGMTADLAAAAQTEGFTLQFNEGIVPVAPIGVRGPFTSSRRAMANWLTEAVP